MKIAVVGAGALGSYYGAMLCRAGQEVHFLLRSDFETVQRQGVSIRSPQGDFHVRPHCARAPGEIGACDLVLIGLKTTANDQFPKLLPPLVGPHTAVITLQNGLGNEEEIAGLFPPAQIMGGLCFVCLNRVQPGVIVHMGHGAVVLGEFQRPPESRTHDVADLFRRAGVDCKVADNLARAHWEKLVWNVPFNGLGVAGTVGYDTLLGSEPLPSSIGPCLPTDQLLADPRWEELVRELMAEVIATGRALGYEIPDSFAEKQIERTRSMGAYRASTLIDFERGLPLELEGLFGEPLRQARAAGVPTPRLEALYRALKVLDPAGRSVPAGVLVLKDGQTVAFLGDSITDAGWGRPSGYIQLAVAGLEANGVRINVIPAGVAGHKSNQMLRRLKRDVLSHRPHWMVLSCGANDVWQGEKGVPPDKFKANVAEIVDHCQSAGIQVMLCTTGVLGEELDNDTNRRLVPYNEIYRELARAKHCLLADINAAFHQAIRAGQQLTTDGAHLNPRGDTVMARCILLAFGLDEVQISKAVGAWGRPNLV